MTYTRVLWEASICCIFTATFTPYRLLFIMIDWLDLDGASLGAAVLRKPFF